MDALTELRGLVTRLAQRPRESALPRLHLGYDVAPTAPTPLMTAATLALVVQGAKRSGLGARIFDYGAGHVLITTVRAPLTTQITKASAREPFLGVGLTLEPARIASLLLHAPSAAVETPAGVTTTKASDGLLDAFRRYVRLLESPADIAALADGIEREILWRALQGPQAAALREAGRANSNLMRVSRAIDLLQRRFAEPLPATTLARAARMSVASFNRHFRRVTALSPLQFHKLVRLQEARARLLSDTSDIGSIAFAVGYQSAAHFSRDYRRQFGVSPTEDVTRWRTRS